MQIPIGTRQINLKVSDPFEPISNRRLTRSVLGAVADHGNIGSKLLLNGHFLVVLAGQKSRQSRAARFLFALDQKLDLNWQVTLCLQIRFDPKHMSDHLAFVVGRSACIDFSIPHTWLKRRCVPQLNRIRRLDIVVTVNQNRGRALNFWRFSVDQRVAASLNQLGF